MPEFVSITKDLQNKILKQSCTALFHIGSSQGERRHSASHNISNNDWKWGTSSYVRLPLSSSFYIVEASPHVGEVRVPRWQLIQEELTLLASSCDTSQTTTGIGRKIGVTISKYNPRGARNYNFRLLQDPEISGKLKECLPVIAENALHLETRLSAPIPVLLRGSSHTIYLTRSLACSLLANAFLCTIPLQHMENDLPDFNFFKLFHAGSSEEKSKVKLEKLKCILEYFSQIKQLKEEDKQSIISYERRCLPDREHWSMSDKYLCEFKLNSGDGIEQAAGMLQVDFANKRVGGGILSDGMVMEEIRFSISPELIVARLFTESLDDSEVLVVTGTRQFSSYSGYGSTFKFQHPKSGGARIVRDELGREITQVVAMDALHFKPDETWKQYEKRQIDRELHKCFVAFRTGKRATPVATGYWGCGAFNGNPQVKVLIQWLAASQANRPFVMFHTGNPTNSSAIVRFTTMLKERNFKVGDVYKILVKYGQEVNTRAAAPISLIDYIRRATKP